MDIFTDVVFLARFQFAAIAIFHFLFVPLSIGIGLIMAINETRYYRTRKPEDAAATKLWVKIFAVTFAVGVATGITMEFSFGTNWADYSRFVGDIFGAPLAAEALLAFFLESVFLGILVFGRKRVSPKFYTASAWLAWFGSALSALWILIANSWQQTPAGAELSADGTRAVLTDFLAAAFNPSTLSRYTHVVTGVIIMGAFVAMAVGAYYLIKNRSKDFAMKTLRTGAVVAMVTSCLMLVTAHSSAVNVAEEQPTKLAMMEGMYDADVPSLYLLGWVDEETQEVIAPLAIPGGTSFLATGTWDTEFQGLNELAATEKYSEIDPDSLPVNAVFQSYHIMVIMYGLIMISCILALIFSFRSGKIQKMRWLQRLLLISPAFPIIAIITGWLTAELGRIPYVVYPSTSGPEGVSLAITDGVSLSVTAPELIVTILLFGVVYTFLFVAWARMLSRFVKAGPIVEDEDSPEPAKKAKMETASAKGGE